MFVSKYSLRPTSNLKPAPSKYAKEDAAVLPCLIQAVPPGPVPVTVSSGELALKKPIIALVSKEDLSDRGKEPKPPNIKPPIPQPPLSTVQLIPGYLLANSSAKACASV